MTEQEKACVRAMYLLIEQITENAAKGDLSLVTPAKRTGGCDAYQGAPPICRKRDSLDIAYGNIIAEAFEGDVK